MATESPETSPPIWAMAAKQAGLQEQLCSVFENVPLGLIQTQTKRGAGFPCGGTTPQHRDK